MKIGTFCGNIKEWKKKRACGCGAEYGDYCAYKKYLHLGLVLGTLN